MCCVPQLDVLIKLLSHMLHTGLAVHSQMCIVVPSSLSHAVW